MESQVGLCCCTRFRARPTTQRRQCMKSVRGVCLIVLFIFLGVFSSSSLAQGAKTSPGQEVFKSKCTLCHGTDGSGKTTLGQQMKASDLHSVEVQKQTDAELKDI